MAASEITGKASGMPTCEPATLSASASVVCDVAGASAFCLHYATPNVPVLAAFGGERLHSYKLQGSWDLDRAAKENADALFRSVRRLPFQDAPPQWDDLTFQFGSRAFVYANNNQIVGFASSLAEAERLVREFSNTCSTPASDSGGTFHLIQQSQYNIGCEPVILPPATLLTPETLTSIRHCCAQAACSVIVSSTGLITPRLRVSPRASAGPCPWPAIIPWPKCTREMKALTSRSTGPGLASPIRPATESARPRETYDELHLHRL